MFQRITLIGRVGKDPVMRYTPQGTPVTSFSIATTEVRSKNGPNGPVSCPEGWKESYNGKNWELTTWWDVTCWRGLAETVNSYLSKGRQAFVEGVMKGEASNGNLNPRIWQGNDGVSRASFELTARTVKFLGGRGDSAPGPSESGVLAASEEIPGFEETPAPAAAPQQPQPQQPAAAPDPFDRLLQGTQ